jgi:hypothetical protein
MAVFVNKNAVTIFTIDRYRCVDYVAVFASFTLRTRPIPIVLSRKQGTFPHRRRRLRDDQN